MPCLRRSMCSSSLEKLSVRLHIARKISARTGINQERVLSRGRSDPNTDGVGNSWRTLRINSWFGIKPSTCVSNIHRAVSSGRRSLRVPRISARCVGASSTDRIDITEVVVMMVNLVPGSEGFGAVRMDCKVFRLRTARPRGRINAHRRIETWQLSLGRRRERFWRQAQYEW
jgi:hypothetical protein